MWSWDRHFQRGEWCESVSGDWVGPAHSSNCPSVSRLRITVREAPGRVRPELMGDGFARLLARSLFSPRNPTGRPRRDREQDLRQHARCLQLLQRPGKNRGQRGAHFGNGVFLRSGPRSASGRSGEAGRPPRARQLSARLPEHRPPPPRCLNILSSPWRAAPPPHTHTSYPPLFISGVCEHQRWDRGGLPGKPSRYQGKKVPGLGDPPHAASPGAPSSWV